jgi:type IV pilus assembly protein PilA
MGQRPSAPTRRVPGRFRPAAPRGERERYHRAMRARGPLHPGGFSFIEMLFALAMAGILLALAIPTVQDMVLRKQVQEGLALAKLAEAGVQAAWTLSGKMPAGNAEAGIPVPEKIVGNLVSRVEVRDGAVTLAFGNNASKSLLGKKLTLRPAVVADTPMVPIAWLCNSASAPLGMTVLGENATDIPAKWLPVECRASSDAK